MFLRAGENVNERTRVGIGECFAGKNTDFLLTESLVSQRFLPMSAFGSRSFSATKFESVVSRTATIAAHSAVASTAVSFFSRDRFPARLIGDCLLPSDPGKCDIWCAFIQRAASSA